MASQTKTEPTPSSLFDGDSDLHRELFPFHLLSSGGLVGQRQFELDR